MEPMKPMEPMKGMEPMKPMEPMGGGEAWWPSDMGQPASTGSSNGVRYAFFPGPHRLLVEEHGTTTAYDTGDHQIGGASQADGPTPSLLFSSQHGEVKLSQLKKVE